MISVSIDSINIFFKEGIWRPIQFIALLFLYKGNIVKSFDISGINSGDLEITQERFENFNNPKHF